MFYLLLLGLAGLVLMGGSSITGDPSSPTKETLFEPPDAGPSTFDYRIDLVISDEGATAWTVIGRDPAFSAQGSAPNRERAVDEAYAVIEKRRGKLPSPMNRYGLRVAADCSNVTVQELSTWLSWAEPTVDIVAGELQKQGRLTGPQLMRGVWARAFGKCPDATPRIRGASWTTRAEQVDRIVEKQLAGNFIDVHPVGRVLAARMVGMSPPKVPGRAFFHESPSGTKMAVIVDRVQTAVGPRWRWRVWPGPVGGLVRETGDAGTEGQAADDARAFIDGLATAGVEGG